MATAQQRAEAIVGAVINGAATAFLINRVGMAIAEMNGQLDHYATLTNAEKYQFVVRHYRDHTVSLVSSADKRAAERAANSSASLDFAEQP